MVRIFLHTYIILLILKDNLGSNQLIAVHSPKLKDVDSFIRVLLKFKRVGHVLLICKPMLPNFILHRSIKNAPLLGTILLNQIALWKWIPESHIYSISTITIEYHQISNYQRQLCWAGFARKFSILGLLLIILQKRQ